MKITVYTTHYNKLDLLFLQHHYLDKWCKETIDYVVINNGIDENTRAAISIICQELGVSEVVIVDNSKTNMTAMNHKAALQFCYDNYIVNDKSDIRVVMDCDIIPFTEFSFVEMLGNADLAGIRLNNGTIAYIASFITIFSNNVDLTGLNMRSDIDFDSGMATIDLVNKYKTRWLDHTAPVRQAEALYIFRKNREMYDQRFGVQFIARSLLHYYRGTGWDNGDINFYRRKSQFIRSLIHNPQSFNLRLDEKVHYDSAHMDQWVNNEKYPLYNITMNTLRDLFYTRGFNYYPTDKETTHCYLDSYDKLFKPFQDKEINVLEVGVHEGGSLRLWGDYFVNGTIIGHDIVNIVRPGILNDRVLFNIKNINNVTPDEFKDTPLTIAIDDGSHTLADQLTFIRLIYPQIVEGGMLIVEDIQDIDKQLITFETLNQGMPFEVIDLRHVRNRYDDVLLVFRK